jgi:uncharacterized protein YbjT (DUF2867 family)
MYSNLVSLETPSPPNSPPGQQKFSRSARISSLCFCGQQNLDLEFLSKVVVEILPEDRSEELMKVFVAGATGETGRRIVGQLVSRQIPVVALVRDLEKAKGILPSEAQWVVGDVLHPAGLEAAIADCTVLISATGAAPSFNPLGPYQVDYQGTKNLVDLAKKSGIEHFVMVSSLCTSQFFHPLNLFWLILFWKQQAESYLQASGLNYTIVRPGGLKNEDNTLPLVMSGPDTLFEGSLPRNRVAEVCIEALFQSSARNKILEIVTQANAPDRSLPELFLSLV